MDKMTPPGPDETQRYQETLQRLERFARLMDSRFRIPMTDIRFGLGPLMGLVPVVGDVAGLFLSIYIILESRRVNAPGSLQLRMLGNGILDAAGGALPFLGDVFDVWYRANDRNVVLLRHHLHKRLETPREPEWHYNRYWLIGGVIVLALALLLWAIAV